MLRSPLAPDILENRIRFYGHMNKKDYGGDVVIGLLKLTINEVKKKCMMIFRTTAAFFYYHLHGMSFFTSNGRTSIGHMYLPSVL